MHGPTAAPHWAIAMHRLLPSRLSKWRPAAWEVRLRRGKRQAEHKVKRFPLRLFIPSVTRLVHNSSSPSQTETGVSNGNVQTLRRTNGKYPGKQTKKEATEERQLVDKREPSGSDPTQSPSHHGSGSELHLQSIFCQRALRKKHIL